MWSLFAFHLILTLFNFLTFQHCRSSTIPLLDYFLLLYSLLHSLSIMNIRPESSARAPAASHREDRSNIILLFNILFIQNEVFLCYSSMSNELFTRNVQCISNKIYFPILNKDEVDIKSHFEKFLKDLISHESM